VDDSVSRETPPAPPVAAELFGDALGAAQRYADLLAGPGTERGLLGPREVPRLWERHVLNCALVADLLPHDARVCDIGSGAGLPGLVLAIRRPAARVTLVEPLLRRTRFLDEVVDELALRNVEVVRGRAESLHGTRTFDVVTSRAVAPLPVLLAWSMPLIAEGGLLLAMKGSSAQQELEQAEQDVARYGGRGPEVVVLEHPGLPSPTTVVRLEAGPPNSIAWQEAPGTATRSSRRRRKKR
jgi:16S rRNA (guanine527-N7)-methyltransferase